MFLLISEVSISFLWEHLPLLAIATGRKDLYNFQGQVLNVSCCLGTLQRSHQPFVKSNCSKTMKLESPHECFGGEFRWAPSCRQVPAASHGSEPFWVPHSVDPSDNCSHCWYMAAASGEFSNGKFSVHLSLPSKYRAKWNGCSFIPPNLEAIYHVAIVSRTGKNCPFRAGFP